MKLPNDLSKKTLTDGWFGKGLWQVLVRFLHPPTVLSTSFNVTPAVVTTWLVTAVELLNVAEVLYPAVS